MIERAIVRAVVLSVQRRFAFSWSGTCRATALGGFGLDPARLVPVRALVGSTWRPRRGFGRSNFDAGDCKGLLSVSAPQSFS
jgi:hypothetical protein